MLIFSLNQICYDQKNSEIFWKSVIRIIWFGIYDESKNFSLCRKNKGKLGSVEFKAYDSAAPFKQQHCHHLNDYNAII